MILAPSIFWQRGRGLFVFNGGDYQMDALTFYKLAKGFKHINASPQRYNQRTKQATGTSLSGLERQTTVQGIKADALA